MASKSRKTASKKVRKSATKKRPEEVSETCLHKHCQQWLEKSGMWGRLLIFHVPNERKGGIGAIMHFKRMGVRPGVADYLLFKGSNRIAIELKDVDGPQRTDQERFQEKWEANGGIYHLVRTVEDFQNIVNLAALFG